MFPLAVALSLLLPLPQRSQFAASRWLPDDRTLLVLEAVDPNLLHEHRGKIAQLAVFDVEKVRRFVRFLGEEDATFGRFLKNSHEVGQLLCSFDRGITLANVFETGRNYSPMPYFLGAAGEAARLRANDPILERVLGVDDPALRGKLKTQQLPIADSPVSARIVRRANDPDQDWGRHVAFYAARKGRVAAIYSVSRFLQDQGKLGGEMSSQLDGLGKLLGLGATSRGGAALGRRPQLPEGQRLLARFALRFDKVVQNPKLLTDRARKEMRQAGFWGWEGMQALTILDGSEIREQIEFHSARTTKPSFFDLFAEGELGLGDAAAYVPREALGAVRVGFDPALTTAWSYTMGELNRENEASVAAFLRELRGILGLPSTAAEKPGLDGLTGITTVLLPAAAGSLMPELAFLVRIPGREGQVEEALTGAARAMFATMERGRAVEPRIRTYGKGEDRVQYVNLKRLFPQGGGGMNPGALEWTIVSSLFGGGYLTATRVGPYFVLGFNPKSIKRLKASVRAGEVLAKRPGFAARFPAGSGRALEAWFDFPALATRMQVLETGIPLFFLAAAPGGTVKLPPVPSLRDIAPVLGEERLWTEKTDYGWLVHHDGGTVLSPTAWAGVGYAVYFLEMYSRVVR